MFVCQFGDLQRPRHGGHPHQRSRGYGEAARGEDGGAARPHRGLLLPGGAPLPVDHLQLHLLPGPGELLQPQAAPRAAPGREPDLRLPLGLPEGDAQTADAGPPQQPPDGAPGGRRPPPAEHHLPGPVQQPAGQPPLRPHGPLASVQREAGRLRLLAEGDPR